MRLYKVQVTAGDENNPARAKWAGTQGDASSARRTLCAAHGLGPRSAEVTVEQVEVPTDKAGLLSFLNENEDAAYAEAKRCGGEE